MSSETWQAFQLRPDDVLFFRDGKPSTIGSDHYLRSIFPPFPSTLYGAVRTWRLLDAGIELEGLGEKTWGARLGSLTRELGGWNGFGSLELRGPWLVRSKAEVLLPAPADLGLVIEKSAARSGPARPRVAAVLRFRLEESGNSQRGWSHPLGLLRPYERTGDRWRLWEGKSSEPRSAAGWYLTPAAFAAWRRGEVPTPKDLIDPTELWERETRTGVGLEGDKRSGKSGSLYTFGFIRLRPGIRIGFEIRGGSLRTGERVRLGGEGRTAVLETGPSFPAMPADRIADPNRRTLSLCLVTPMLSRTGAYPPGFSAEQREGELAELPCRLIGAAVPGFVTVGGWDLARHRPKPLRRAMPAGSVFLIETTRNGVPAVDGACLSDFPAEHLARQGFGLMALGVSG